MYDRLKSGSWTRWFIALVVGVALFLLRRKYLGGVATPDSFWQGYTPGQVAEFLRQIGPAGRSLYAWTQLTLDVGALPRVCWHATRSSGGQARMTLAD